MSPSRMGHGLLQAQTRQEDGVEEKTNDLIFLMEVLTKWENIL
jgi:hypothetical protein